MKKVIARLLSKPSNSEEFLGASGAQDGRVFEVGGDPSSGVARKLPERRRLGKKSIVLCIVISAVLLMQPAEVVYSSDGADQSSEVGDHRKEKKHHKKKNKKNSDDSTSSASDSSDEGTEKKHKKKKRRHHKDKSQTPPTDGTGDDAQSTQADAPVDEARLPQANSADDQSPEVNRTNHEKGKHKKKKRRHHKDKSQTSPTAGAGDTQQEDKHPRKKKKKHSSNRLNNSEQTEASLSSDDAWMNVVGTAEESTFEMVSAEKMAVESAQIVAHNDADSRIVPDGIREIETFESEIPVEDRAMAQAPNLGHRGDSKGSTKLRQQLEKYRQLFGRSLPPGEQSKEQA
ncbi:MAG: hypothetical protein LBG20_02285 [Holosporaceae bacterium]|nr:hypothetical protein [Holosporaceae bacterium]